MRTTPTTPAGSRQSWRRPSGQSYAASLHAHLHTGEATQGRHVRIEQGIKSAVERAYLVGQLAAMPMLVKVPKPGAQGPTAGAAGPRPGVAGFDVSCLTDPASRAAWQRDPTAVRAVEGLWANDPDPGETLRIQAEIDERIRRGDVVRTPLGNYYCCPWAPIYQAVNPVTIGTARLRRGQTFAFDVSAEEMAEGGRFKREVLVATFSPTSVVDYCNPEIGQH